MNTGWICPTCGNGYAPWYPGPCPHPAQVPTDSGITDQLKFDDTVTGEDFPADVQLNPQRNDAASR